MPEGGLDASSVADIIKKKSKAKDREERKRKRKTPKFISAIS